MTHIPSVNLCEKNSCFVLWGPNLSFWLLVFLMPTFWKKKKKRSKVKKKKTRWFWAQPDASPPPHSTWTPANPDPPSPEWWRHKVTMVTSQKKPTLPPPPPPEKNSSQHLAGPVVNECSWIWKLKKKKIENRNSSGQLLIRTQQLDVHLVCRRRRKKTPKSWRVDVKTYISHSFSTG